MLPAEPKHVRLLAALSHRPTLLDARPQHPLRLPREELFEIHVLLGLKSQQQQAPCLSEQLEAQQKQAMLVGVQPGLQLKPSKGLGPNKSSCIILGSRKLQHKCIRQLSV